MEKAEENRGNECFSRDLLHNIINGKRNCEFDENVGAEDDIELSLGLSLNGRFGMEPKREKRLKRSCSSITNFVFSFGDNYNNSYGNEIQFGDAIYAPLNRTCSLPTETEEEWRKRKELQSLRRLEAKRKRLEKMKNVVKGVVKENEENGNSYSNGTETCGNFLQSSGGSLGSQGSGSGSSGISEFESHQPIQGRSDSTEARPAASGQSPEHEQKSVAIAPETSNEKAPVSSGKTCKEAKEMFKNFMLNMPCVSTRGDGPNGKKIEGFLYGYKKGEEVRIVCVCHGDFLSPAEFVKHAGGGDVQHPLKHIVVNPSPLL
ncbi:PREDICTED: ninja-family protein AFP3-like [Nicotiana attenuata]|uniref:Ninja-family protein n=1 Tax=Nicotiana attenuata TaxID=49451 RepID=A0A1J6IRL6_NICAT|nr:PREDICTED: ninja-family protein AFP3-like [Nicotiana attenuata]OIS97792.1 ninja-family protein afp3 [Nicotiana attenuata]